MPNAEEADGIDISHAAQLARAGLQNLPSEHAAAVKDSILRENEERFGNRQGIQDHITATQQRGGEKYTKPLQDIADEERADDKAFAAKHQDVLEPQALADMEAAKADSQSEQKAA